MRIAARVARLEAGLAASDAVLAWLREALQFDDVEAYVAACLATEPPVEPLGQILDDLARRLTGTGAALVVLQDRYRREAIQARVLYALVRQLQEHRGGAQYHAVAHMRLRVSSIGGPASTIAAGDTERERMLTVWVPAALAVLTAWRLDRAARTAIEREFLGGRDVRFASTRRVDRTTETEATMLEQLVADVVPDGLRLVASASPRRAAVRAEVDRRTALARLEAATSAGRAELALRWTRRLVGDVEGSRAAD